MEIRSNVNAALNILQRTPVEDTEQNLGACSVLLHPDEESAEDLFQRVDCPLKEAVDESMNSNSTPGNINATPKKYILSDHNRDGDSYRSPWSNEYYPPVGNTSAFRPSRQLRKLEELANEVFDSYRQLYYGKDVDGNFSSISSVYLWNKEGGFLNEGFAGCFLIKKAITENCSNNMTTPASGRLRSGYWNSIHVIDVSTLSRGTAKYELSTTVILSLDIECANEDGKCVGNNMKTKIGGSLTKQVEKIIPCPNESSHIANIGQMIENAEIEMRSNMDALYIQKTREVIDSIRSGSGRNDHRHLMKHGVMAAMMTNDKGQTPGHSIQNEVNAALLARFQKK